MRIKAKSGDLPFKLFTFPDGQRHFELLLGSEFREATIEARIANAEELFDVLLAADALRSSGHHSVSLDIRYLLGARMDRRIGATHPSTLEIVARILRGAGFAKIRVLDPHSGVALHLLDAEAVLPVVPVSNVLSHYLASDTVIVAPDAGAAPRVQQLLARAATERRFRVVQGVKHRDPATGALSGFGVQDASVVDGKDCLILDDICDGGGTFTGLAATLKRYGAKSVDLFVTHGIFSKGVPLPGIRSIFTTDSYVKLAPEGVIVLKVNMDTVERSPEERAEVWR